MPYFKECYVSEDVPGVGIAAPAIIHADPFETVWSRVGRVDAPLARQFVENRCPNDCVAGAYDSPLVTLLGRVDFYANLYISIARDHNKQGHYIAAAKKEDIPHFSYLNRKLVRELKDSGYFTPQAQRMRRFLESKALNDAIQANVSGFASFAQLAEAAYSGSVKLSQPQQDRLVRVICQAYDTFCGWSKTTEINFKDQFKYYGQFEAVRDGVTTILRRGLLDMIGTGLHEKQHRHGWKMGLSMRDGSEVLLRSPYVRILDANMQAYISYDVNPQAYVAQPAEKDARFVQTILTEWTSNLMYFREKARKANVLPFRAPPKREAALLRAAAADS